MIEIVILSLCYSMPVSANATEFPTFSIVVNDTTPIWGYCRQTGHCGQGMVFAINAVDSSAKNFTAFQSQAIQINGTSTAATTSPSATTSTTSGAGRLVGAGSGLVMGLVGAIFLLL